MTELAVIIEAIAPALRKNPVTNQILIDADSKIVSLFLPA